MHCPKRDAGSVVSSRSLANQKCKLATQVKIKIQVLKTQFCRPDCKFVQDPIKICTVLTFIAINHTILTRFSHANRLFSLVTFVRGQEEGPLYLFYLLCMWGFCLRHEEGECVSLESSRHELHQNHTSC